MSSSAPSQKLPREVSPRSGRKNLAHGVSRGSMRAPSSPAPLPPERERGAEGGVRAVQPRACALGYYLSPLTGLLQRTLGEEDSAKDPLVQDTSLRLRLPHSARPNLFGGD